MTWAGFDPATKKHTSFLSYHWTNKTRLVSFNPFSSIKALTHTHNTYTAGPFSILAIEEKTLVIKVWAHNIQALGELFNHGAIWLFDHVGRSVGRFCGFFFINIFFYLIFENSFFGNLFFYGKKFFLKIFILKIFYES